MRHGSPLTRWLIALAMAGAVGATGCKGESAAEAGDIAKTHSEGQEKVAEASAQAQQDIESARQAETQATIDAAGNPDPADAAQRNMEARTETVRQEAEGRYKVEAAELEAAFNTEKKRCETLASAERGSCVDTAKADYDRKLAEAKARRDSTPTTDRPSQRPARLIAC